MKTKTIVELLTLSATLYHLAKDTHVIERISEFSEKNKGRINSFAAETILDEDGNEMELLEKIFHKAGEVKEELEVKVEELVHTFYKKIHVAHLDEIKALNERLENSNMTIALLEARLNRLEQSK